MKRLNYILNTTKGVGVEYYYRGTANRAWRELEKDLNFKV